MRASGFLVALALGGASLGLVACGSNALSSAVQRTSPTGRPQGQRAALFNNPTVRACLKKHGVNVPNFAGGPRRNFNGTVPRRPPFNGTVPQRPPANGNRPNFRNNPRFKALRAAMQACGVTPQFGRPPSSTTPSTTPAQ
jgi:hypothetical protein